MIEKELVRYAEIIGEVVIGKGAVYVLSVPVPGLEGCTNIRGLTNPVLEYDEATETFTTEDAVYTPA
jgi:hypothetical protein